MMAQPQPAYGPNRIRASTARPRFGARTGRFEAGFGRSHGWRRPKCRLRRSVRPVGRDEGTREAGGLPGEKTFGVICQRERSFQSHSPQPEGRAKPHRGQSPRVLHGEAMPLRRGTTFSRGMTLAPLTLTLSRKGRGELILHGEAMLSKALDGIQPRNDVSSPHPNPLPQGARGSDRRMPRLHGRPQKNRSPRAAVFLLGQPVSTNSATGLRHGASWSCRRCLPARCPSR